MGSRQGERYGRAGKGKGPYLGVRPRGEKWVSEIRIPKKGKTIWLGSHVSPEMAARAYDAASYCLNGETKPFNFPNNKRPDLDKSVGSLTIPEIQSIAAQFSCLDISVSSSNPQPVFSPVACQESPELPIANHPHGTNEACFNKVGAAAYAPISSVEIEPCIPTFGVEEPYYPIDKLEIARMLDENPELDEWFCGDRDWIKNLKWL